MKRRLQNLSILTGSCVLALLLAEVVGRLLMQPDSRGFGSLFGVVLPPLRIFPPEPGERAPRDAPYGDLIVNGQRIAVGDAAGFHRFDALLGYTTLESTVSRNGWWQSNEIGAREAAATDPRAAPGRTRWLLLGESFAHGVGLPGSQVWAEVAETRDPGVDIVNLAVGGYSMAQAWLRYRSLVHRLEHQGALLMFVPGADLWRDVNVVRELREPWKVRAVMPRFVLDGAGIRLVVGPYASPQELDADNRTGLGATLRDHLRRYDRFYFRVEHEPVPVIGGLLSVKVGAAAYGRYARGRIGRAQFQPDSEALEISRRIFHLWQMETDAQAREFMLLVLPTATDLDRLRSEPAFAGEWRELVDVVCSGLRRCVDLAAALRAVPAGEIDLGADGGHYGRRANAIIADAVLELLPRADR